LAVKDFKTVCKYEPQNKDARLKYDLTLKEHKLREFAKCLGYDNTKVELNVEDLTVEDSYTGPRLEKVEDINEEWVLSLLSYMKDGKILHKKYASMIILKARDVFEKESTL